MEENTCSYCGGSGIFKYQELDGMTIYRWQPWLTMPCPRCNHDNYRAHINTNTINTEGKQQ